MKLCVRTAVLTAVRDGTGKAEGAKPQDAGISLKQCPEKMSGRKKLAYGTSKIGALILGRNPSTPLIGAAVVHVIFAHRYEPEGDIEIILLAKGPAPGSSLAGNVVLAFGTD
jgi:hypothetical protein